MIPNDFYSERKWCNHCNRYVSYLMSLNKSYCVDCGTTVTLFSKEDREKFEESINQKKNKAS